MCKFIAVTNRNLCDIPLTTQVEKLVKNGVDQIVLREKDLSEREYLRLAKEVQNICREYGVPCILHSFFSVAKKLDADGIHMPLLLAMKNREKLKYVNTVGVSTHSYEQIQLAIASNATYVFYGHVFETDCKKNLEPRGITKLNEMCQKTNIPVYALGGINFDNVNEIKKAGANGACFMSWAMKANEDEIKRMAELCHVDK